MQARKRGRTLPLATLAGLLALAGSAPAGDQEPVRLIYDTDMGNDVDDALALGVIHALQTRGECKLLAVTVTKDHALSAPFVDAVNTFYGRPDIPVGVVRDGPTTHKGRFLGLAKEKDGGELRYPHDLRSGKDAPEATTVLRRVLAGQPDHSVVMVQVGFSTNYARLLKSEPDRHSSLDGRALVAKKVDRLSVMAGAFERIPGKGRHREYNVIKDIPAARALAEDWPTAIVYSGYEVGYSIRYPAVSIERDYDYVEHHPLREAYQRYKPTPHERPTWDLTSVLEAVRPARGYFALSKPGRVTIEDDGYTRFAPKEGGRHRYLVVDEKQRVRIREALAQLASQLPLRRRERNGDGSR